MLWYTWCCCAVLRLLLSTATAATAAIVTNLQYLFPFDFFYLFSVHAVLTCTFVVSNFNLKTFVSFSAFLSFSWNCVLFNTIWRRKKNLFLHFCFSTILFCCCFAHFDLWCLFLFIYLFILSFILYCSKQPYKLKLICLAKANSLNIIGWEKWLRHSKRGRYVFSVLLCVCCAFFSFFVFRVLKKFDDQFRWKL